jgi:uncharacterized protein (TIGR03000 family)
MMRYLSMTPTKGMLFACLAVLLLADTASAQRRSRGGWNQGYYQSYYPPTDGYGYQQFQQTGQSDGTYRSYYPPARLPATIELIVPADAQVWFNGQATTQTGTVRRFVTPELNADSDYTYELKVRWNKDGQPTEKTRQISVVAGGVRQVNLLQPSREMRENRESGENP